MTKYIDLLKRMISTPSFSGQEEGVADIIEEFLKEHGVSPLRIGNNVVAVTARHNPKRPTMILNSHIDTVKPSPSYTFNPFTPFEKEGRLYGLGSNDAGGAVVSLIATFLTMRSEELPFNLLLAISAEEENGGVHGMRFLLPALRERGINPDMGIVGEPTQMQPAVAERGLVVLDALTRGISGHAARNEGVNALYRAMEDIDRLRNCRFERESEVLGPIKVTVTGIQAGTTHNVIPDQCSWVVDLRTTDAYSNIETVEILQRAVSEHTLLTPRSTHIRASVAADDSPLVAGARELGLTPFVSPTGSDMSQMHNIPTIKIGPGDSPRSHTADEYILISEIEQALELYPRLIQSIANQFNH